MGRVTYLSTGHPYTVVEPCGVDDSDIGVPLIAPSLQKARDRIRRDRLECGRDEPERIDCLPFGRGRTLVLVYEDQHNEPPLQLVYEEEPEKHTTFFQELMDLMVDGDIDENSEHEGWRAIFTYTKRQLAEQEAL